MLAINVINDIGKETGWDRNSKLIIACEFISSLDKDRDFNNFCEDKKKEEKK